MAGRDKAVTRFSKEKPFPIPAKNSRKPSLEKQKSRNMTEAQEEAELVKLIGWCLLVFSVYFQHALK
jgi:hypothetical protein